MKSLGQNIKNLRMSNAYDRANFAKDLGVDYSTVWLWETDKKKPSLKNRRKIAKLLKIDVKELLE